MAYEYALVHLKFTIPVAVFLTLILYPILNRSHVLQISTTVIIAFFATLPWDAYLINQNIWSYPADAIIGPRLFAIPIEELFFFVIQTYITAQIYILFNKPLLHALYLSNQTKPPTWAKRASIAGKLLLATLALLGLYLVCSRGGEGTYLGLILAWACPFALITWSVAGYFILSLPWACTIAPILLPTLYLWIVDELALGRGTWSIGSGTKLEMRLFGALEIEEATFFLVTNMLIVFGMATFDKYLAVIDAFPSLFPTVPKNPTPLILIQSRLTRSSDYDLDRIDGIKDAVDRLHRKSRSFSVANTLFSGRLRIDLILLYSFCRMADDLVDAETAEDVLSWTSKLTRFLDLSYQKESSRDQVQAFVEKNFPAYAHSALLLLPTEILPSEPLYLLIKGFEMDSQFSSMEKGATRFPIKDEDALKEYSIGVAGTVGELCVALIVHHCEPDMDETRRSSLLEAACRMGIALQYVNIARDVVVDVRMGRVYLPTTWLTSEGLSSESVIKDPQGDAIEQLRRRLLDMAFGIYREARPTMDWIPDAGRGPMIAAVESYMEIGRVLLEKDGFFREEGKATVPPFRRLRTAIKALYEK